MEPFHLKRGVAQEQSFMHLLILWFIHLSSTIIIASIKREEISKLQPSLKDKKGLNISGKSTNESVFFFFNQMLPTNNYLCIVS